MRKVRRLLRDDGDLDRDLLGVSTFLADVADGEYLIADTQVCDASPDSRDDTGEVASENVGKPGKQARFTLTHLPVRAIDAGGDDIDHDLARCRHRIRHLAELQNFRPAMSFDEGSFHEHSSTLEHQVC